MFVRRSEQHTKYSSRNTLDHVSRIRFQGRESKGTTFIKVVKFNHGTLNLIEKEIDRENMLNKEILPFLLI